MVHKMYLIRSNEHVCFVLSRSCVIMYSSSSRAIHEDKHVYTVCMCLHVKVRVLVLCVYMSACVCACVCESICVCVCVRERESIRV